MRGIVPFAWAALLGLPLLSDQPAIRTTTHLVVINVVVKDKHGKPVADLKREDFTLLDNGRAQTIAMFSLDDARQSAGAAPELAPRTFTNRPPLGAAHATAFLFDELNTKLADQQTAKQELVRYLRRLPAGERVAVFVLGDSLTLVRDFVNAAALRPSQEAAVSDAAPVSSNSLTGDSTTSAQWDGFLASAEQSYTDYAETVRALRTAAALETIAAHLQSIPGRKSLIWISSGFPIQLGLHDLDTSAAQSNTGGSGRAPREGRSGGGARGAGRSAGVRSGGGGGAGTSSTSSSASPSSVPLTGTSFEDDVARAIRALNEAGVAVYPVDARGLVIEAPFQADSASYGKRGRPPRAGGPPVNYNYETLEGLAQETGGRAFHHINDLHNAIEEAANDAQVSYSLAFYPPLEGLDDSYHRLAVSVDRPHVSVRYRPGYEATRQPAVAPLLADAIANPIALAGIGFTAHLDPVEGGYKISVTIDPRNITLEPKDGKWTGSLQFLVVVGKTEQLTTVPLSFTDALYHQIQEQGLVLGARVRTPPGTTGFGVGFRDIPSGAVGTLHVPIATP